MKLGALARRAAEAALARAGSALDRGALGVIERRVAGAAPPADARARLLELVAHYGQPTMLADPGALFVAPPPVALVQRALGDHGGARVVALSFESGYRPSAARFAARHAAFAANLTARARWYRGGRAPRPTLIALHGFAAPGFALNRAVFEVDRLLRHGLDVVLLQLPLHGERAGTLAATAPLFPSSDLIRTNESLGQAVWDVRALTAALRAEGAPAVGLIGMSLGGYVTALTATVEPALEFAGALLPAVSMARLMWSHGKDSPTRRRAERAGVDLALLEQALAVHAPLGRPTKLAADRLFVAAGRADAITPPAEAEALARHWGIDVHWFPGGHLAQVGRGGAFRALVGRLVALGLARA